MHIKITIFGKVLYNSISLFFDSPLFIYPFFMVFLCFPSMSIYFYPFYINHFINKHIYKYISVYKLLLLLPFLLSFSLFIYAYI